MSEQTISHFIVLFTAQKQKKFKTWQDGTMKYYSFNKKLVLTDEKGYNIDRKFYKAGIPIVGDEIEFDGHIVTIESYESTESVHQPQPVYRPDQRSSSPQLSEQRSVPQPHQQQQQQQQQQQRSVPPPPQPPQRPISRFKFKPPSTTFSKRIIQIDAEKEDDEDIMEIDVPEFTQPIVSPGVNTATNQPLQPGLDEPPFVPQKRVRVGLSKRTSSVLHQSTYPSVADIVPPPTVQLDTQTVLPEYDDCDMDHGQGISKESESSFAPASRIPTEIPVPESNNNILDPTKPFKSPFADGTYAMIPLQFPNSKKVLNILKSKKHPKRTKVVPVKFTNLNVYRDTFRKIIYEHLEIMLIQYASYFYPCYDKFGKGKQGKDLERIMRSRGIGMYVQCELKGDNSCGSEKRLRLMIHQSRESYSKYNRDDLWVISKVPTFESGQTFLARSTYFGPYSDGSLELDCFSPRDVRVATVCMTGMVYALRTISASTELMMLDTLEDKLKDLPLLPYIMSNGSGKKKRDVPMEPLPVMEYIDIKREDGIDVESILKETVTFYKLNPDQESVLRRVARSVIASPDWNPGPDHPIVLVHGVYGSGKSFLAAVIIIFIQEIVDAVNEKREPEDAIQYRILVSSMTNVAVDRILQTLLKLGYDHFIRIGSMKKITKNLLPYTVKARLNSNEELKELEQMLEDPMNSEEDIENISVAIQKFRKAEGVSQIQNTSVVGTTFMSSTFEVFNQVRFPLVLVDEASQLMEPLTMVPLTRFLCQRLVMIGDPLQLPPTITTASEEGKIGKGLEKTMFDRLTEIGLESIMLRTQYRCHPQISNISNKLFYDRMLINGITNTDRKPLIEGLPTLLFVDVGGTEQRSIKSKSYWNDTEVSVAAHIIQTLISQDVSPNQLGFISLFKEQVDKMSEFLSSGATDVSASKNVQISTVDAFQGGEKEVIILSTVRTTENQFMENEPRINVALTRAKRHLIILGNKNLLSMNELWSNIIWECQDNSMNANSLARLLSMLPIQTEESN